MKPYYESGGVALYQGRMENVIPELLDEGVAADLVLTDPNYAPETHAGARTNKAGMEDRSPLEGYEPFDDAMIHRVFSLMGALAKAWVIATVDYHHINGLEYHTPGNLEWVRYGIWSKLNAMPQKSGDRPAHGFEAVAHLHRKRGKGEGRMEWNGGGRAAVYTHAVARNTDHPAQKPVPLISEIMQLFSNEGDLVLDPFAGSGTVLRVAKDLGRRAIGIELSTKWCDHIARRLEIGSSFARQKPLPLPVAPVEAGT